ncbi:hypothetical protein HGQ98_22595, partial [Achromobacter ruhlandii]
MIALHPSPWNAALRRRWPAAAWTLGLTPLAAGLLLQLEATQAALGIPRGSGLLVLPARSR